MGNCRSCEITSTVTLTAKLILLNGELREYSWPVKVSYLSPENSDCFVCSSDEMKFGEFAAAMGGDEVLQPGELYFELPLRWRNHRLRAEDMAVLAAKASVALAGKYPSGYGGDWRNIRCCCCGWRKAADHLILFGEKERPLLAADGGGGGGSKGRKFVAKLSTIGED
ncbi:hypothetical protein ACP275_14G117000 [Erythranthe tilingii]